MRVREGYRPELSRKQKSRTDSGLGHIQWAVGRQACNKRPGADTQSLLGMIWIMLILLVSFLQGCIGQRSTNKPLLLCRKTLLRAIALEHLRDQASLTRLTHKVVIMTTLYAGCMASQHVQLVAASG